MVNSKAPMTIVMGNAKTYVNDPALIPSTLLQLGLAKSEVNSTSLIATTAQLIQEATAEITHMPCKSLRDAEYVIRKQLNPSPTITKKIKDLNTTYSFIRHMTSTTCSDLVSQVRALESTMKLPDEILVKDDADVVLPEKQSVVEPVIKDDVVHNVKMTVDEFEVSKGVIDKSVVEVDADVVIPIEKQSVAKDAVASIEKQPAVESEVTKDADDVVMSNEKQSVAEPAVIKDTGGVVVTNEKQTVAETDETIYRCHICREYYKYKSSKKSVTYSTPATSFMWAGGCGNC
eukprot:TRINITY_DN21271_c0_g1_i11.p1 TRINITY_DN21271_c0_g1~~TRINITY_DN21271_c0_g1_i11.p1  ORF type:complete len:339 (-),score=54.18 TRINITY_DN21271_c0_g1_i11:123-989(-)